LHLIQRNFFQNISLFIALKSDHYKLATTKIH